MTFRLSERADQDLATIYAASAEQFGVAQADRYVAGLRSTCRFLSEFPQAAREREEMPEPARAFRYKSHVILYDMEAGGIVIQRIPHIRTDWINQPD